MTGVITSPLRLEREQQTSSSVFLRALGYRLLTAVMTAFGYTTFRHNASRLRPAFAVVDLLFYAISRQRRLLYIDLR